MRLAFVILAACGTLHSQPTPDASPTSTELACESHATTFPPLEKACTVAADCFIAQHMVSCCGTMNAIGFNVSAKPAFMTAETACEAGYPGCGCAEGPPMAEDGRTTVNGTIMVKCDMGLCRTFVP